MTPNRRSTEAERTTEIHLACRLMQTPVPVVLTFVRRSLHHQRGAALTVVVHYRFGGHDTHTFSMRTCEPACAVFADELQLLYDTRDVTAAASLGDESHVGSYLLFRAHDLQAEQISVSGLFRRDAPAPLPRDERHGLDARLAQFGWYQEEKEVIGPWAWVLGFRGLLLSRGGLPPIIAKVRNAAGQAD